MRHPYVQLVYCYFCICFDFTFEAPKRENISYNIAFPGN